MSDTSPILLKPLNLADRARFTLVAHYDDDLETLALFPFGRHQQAVNFDVDRNNYLLVHPETLAVVGAQIDEFPEASQNDHALTRLRGLRFLDRDDLGFVDFARWPNESGIRNDLEHEVFYFINALVRRQHDSVSEQSHAAAAYERRQLIHPRRERSVREQFERGAVEQFTKFLLEMDQETLPDESQVPERIELFFELHFPAASTLAKRYIMLTTLRRLRVRRGSPDGISANLYEEVRRALKNL